MVEETSTLLDVLVSIVIHICCVQVVLCGLS